MFESKPLRPVGKTRVPGQVTLNSSAQVNSTTLSVSFSDVSGATGYEYVVAPLINQEAGNLHTGRWTAPAVLAGNKQISGLVPNTIYDIQVRATNAQGKGQWSNTVFTAATATAVSNKNNVTTISASADPYINGLLATGVIWSFSTTPKILTFSFPQAVTNWTGSASPDSYGGGELAGFSPFTQVQRDAVRRILFHYSTVIPVRFVEMTETDSSHADIRFGNTTTNFTATAFGYFPAISAAGEGGDSWYGHSLFGSPGEGTYGFMGMFHEIGHCLGLKHPHDDLGGSYGPLPHSGDATAADKDCLEFTVMSYRSFLGLPVNNGLTNESNSYPQTFMSYDMQALQYCYGACYDYTTGDTVYAFDSSTGQMFINGIAQTAPTGNRVFRCIWDGGGTDRLDIGSGGYAKGDPTVDLTPGGFSITKAGQQADLGGGHTARGCIWASFRLGSDPTSDIEGSIVP